MGRCRGWEGGCAGRVDGVGPVRVGCGRARRGGALWTGVVAVTVVVGFVGGGERAREAGSARPAGVLTAAAAAAAEAGGVDDDGALDGQRQPRRRWRWRQPRRLPHTCARCGAHRGCGGDGGGGGADVTVGARWGTRWAPRPARLASSRAPIPPSLPARRPCRHNSTPLTLRVPAWLPCFFLSLSFFLTWGASTCIGRLWAPALRHDWR